MINRMNIDVKCRRISFPARLKDIYESSPFSTEDNDEFSDVYPDYPSYHTTLQSIQSWQALSLSSKGLNTSQRRVNTSKHSFICNDRPRQSPPLHRRQRKVSNLTVISQFSPENNGPVEVRHHAASPLPVPPEPTESKAENWNNKNLTQYNTDDPVAIEIKQIISHHLNLNSPVATSVEGESPVVSDVGDDEEQNRDSDNEIETVDTQNEDVQTDLTDNIIEGNLQRNQLEHNNNFDDVKEEVTAVGRQLSEIRNRNHTLSSQEAKYADILDRLKTEAAVLRQSVTRQRRKSMFDSATSSSDNRYNVQLSSADRTRRLHTAVNDSFSSGGGGDDDVYSVEASIRNCARWPSTASPVAAAASRPARQRRRCSLASISEIEADFEREIGPDSGGVSLHPHTSPKTSNCQPGERECSPDSAVQSKSQSLWPPTIRKIDLKSNGEQPAELKIHQPISDNKNFNLVDQLRLLPEEDELFLLPEQVLYKESKAVKQDLLSLASESTSEESCDYTSSNEPPSIDTAASKLPPKKPVSLAYLHASKAGQIGQPSTAAAQAQLFWQDCNGFHLAPASHVSSTVWLCVSESSRCFNEERSFN